MEEETPFTFCPERRKSSESSSSYKPTSSHFNEDNTFLPNPSYNKIKNSQVNSEELLSDFRQYIQKGQTSYDNMDNLDIPFQSNSCMDAADRDSYGAGPMDQSEVAESGFDEEMAETEDHSEVFVEECAQRNLLIQVIPPSRSTSQDFLTEDCTTLSRVPQQKATGTNTVPRKTTSPVDIKVEVKEHLKPPDPVLKDQEDAPDHWAKRRKMFKESRQWSSAGGSSITSNITEESMNSEDNRSVDLSMRDIEDRGFYTETFHSASWIFRGDDVHPKDSPRCLSNRPRPVTIRERTVKIHKGIGDYPWGFRIQFSKPIVVTEVDTNGAAEEAGLQVGDYVLSVNGTDVTSMPHSEAADLARQGPDLLTLTIGSDISRLPNTPRPACRGYLHKRTHSGFLRGWRKRWFVLKHNCCLYYYRHKKDEGKNAPLSSIKLEGAEVGPDSSLGKPFVFKCCPLSSSRVYYFCATSNQEMKRWLEAMERAVHPVTQNHVWIDVTRHNSNLPPLAIKSPECLGLLHQMDKAKDVWVQHYCILKDGCLYLYASIRSTYALGGIYLHGYTLKEQPFGSRRTTIELKPPSEEFKTFYLCAENAAENKRWISALKASISKWVPLHQAIQDFMKRPPEETRM
uniref:PDZ and pleckstrin homology domains 1 n=1 Tax=Scleropages formosus TaxID=113540 RepID=A0A8C9TC75_SCLFO